MPFFLTFQYTWIITLELDSHVEYGLLDQKNLDLILGSTIYELSHSTSLSLFSCLEKWT